MNTAVLAALLALALPSVGQGREVAEKTPTPCKKEYPQEFIEESAKEYVGHSEVMKPHPGGQPHVLILLGGHGAGKTTFYRVKDWQVQFKNVIHAVKSYLYLLPEWKATKHDADKVYKDAADGCYAAAAAIRKAALPMIINNWFNVVYEVDDNELDDVLDVIVPAFRNAAYIINVGLVDSPLELAKARIAERFLEKGRYISPEQVEHSHKKLWDSYRDIRDMDWVNEAMYCDNSCTMSPEEKGHGNRAHCMKCHRDVLKEAKETMLSDEAMEKYKGADKVVYMKGRDGKRKSKDNDEL